MVLVALVGAAAARFFGSDRSDADDDVQGDHKMTRFLFGAANTGDYKDASDLVSEDFTAYANGYRMGSDDVRKGPKLLTAALHYYDENVVDSFWQLYDEVDEVDRHGAGMIAIRFLARGEFGGGHKDGDNREVEMAGFLTIADDQLSELRFVTDLTVFNGMRADAGLPPLE